MDSQIRVRYQTTDGSFFADSEEADRHQTKLNEDLPFKEKEQRIYEEIERRIAKGCTLRQLVHWLVRNHESV